MSPAAAVPIAGYEHLALPGGAELILALTLAFGWLAWLLVSVALGGTLAVFVGKAMGICGPVPTRTIRVLPVLFLLGLVLSVLPLVGTLLLYGHYYLTVSAMTAHFWAAAAVVLFAVFVFLGWAGRTRHRIIQVFASGLAAMALLVLLFFVGLQHWLALRPETWWPLHHYGQGWQDVIVSALTQTIQDVAVAMALAGVLWGWVGRTAQAADPIKAASVSSQAQQSGMLLIAAGMIVALVGEIWANLVTIPEALRPVMFDFAHPATWVWLGGLGLAMFAVFGALFDRKRVWPWFYLSSAAAILAVLGVMVGRFRLRDGMLLREQAGSYDLGARMVVAQTKPTYFFIAVLMAALILISALLWMVFARRKVVQSLPYTPSLPVSPVEPQSAPPLERPDDQHPSDEPAGEEPA